MTFEAMDGCGMGGSCRFSGSSCTAGAAGKVPMSKEPIQGQELGGSHAADVHSEGAFSLRRVAMTRARICRCCPLFLLQLCPAEAATGVKGLFDSVASGSLFSDRVVWVVPNRNYSCSGNFASGGACLGIFHFTTAARGRVLARKFFS